MIVKYMLQHSHLDAVFHALADPTRRAIVERLAAGSAAVSDLAAPFDMSLSAIGQHIKLLEESGLVKTAKAGRVRTVALSTERLEQAQRWFEKHRARWERRLDRLGALLDAHDSDSDSPGARPPRRRR
jgi:DNA-binding transcriptional ArsR family regulator